MSDATLKMPEIEIMILVQDTFFRQKSENGCEIWEKML